MILYYETNLNLFTVFEKMLMKLIWIYLLFLRKCWWNWFEFICFWENIDETPEFIYCFWENVDETDLNLFTVFVKMLMKLIWICLLFLRKY
jgi:hypothetical protein